jgi:UDP-glucose 4-epimerase
MKQAVVTGGAGFIGSHLTEELAARGYRVIILDNLSTGRIENIRGILVHPPKDGAVQLVQESVTDLPLLQKIFRGTDFVFHLAAIASVPASMQDPLASHDVNLTGTLNVLQAARDTGVKKVVGISSSAVYGDTATLPHREDMVPIPKSPYAVTKLAGEYYCRVFLEAFGLPTACLRLFNIYGPRQDPTSQYAAVIPIFLHAVLAGKPPVIFGSGQQTRDFLFVKDAVAAAVLAAESDATGIYNIGSGKTVTINELAGIILKIIGKDIEPVHQDIRAGDIEHSRADINRASSFGFRPEYSLEEGLKETLVTFYKKN